MEQRVAKIRYFDDLEILVHDGDLITEAMFRNSVWEASLSERFLPIASTEGGLMIDVGANVGYFSLLWAKARSTNESYAFEASPRNIPRLISNVQRNQLSGQIGCFGVALSNTTGIASFVLGPEEQTGWGGIVTDDAATKGLVKVVLCRMDDLIPNRKIRLLKIDVEGADFLVIKGAERLLRSGQVEEIFYEENVPRLSAIGLKPGLTKEFLNDLGYDVELLEGDLASVSEWRAVLRS